jgi:hypothetical protein
VPTFENPLKPGLLAFGWLFSGTKKPGFRYRKPRFFVTHGR